MRYFFSIICLLFSVGIHSQFVATTGYSGIGGAVASPLLDSLFAYYSLEETSGNALDLVGSNDLSLAGSTVTQDTTGKIDSCYYFESTGHVEKTTDDFSFPGSFSVAGWVSSPDVDEYNYIVAYKNSATLYGWETYINDGPSTGRLAANLYDGSSQYQLTGSTVINDEAWYHFALTYEASDDTAKLYINGVMEDSDKVTNPVAYSSCTLAFAARGSGANYLEGFVDEIAIYRGIELRQGQIDSLYNSGSGLAYPLDY